MEAIFRRLIAKLDREPEAGEYRTAVLGVVEALGVKGDPQREPEMHGAESAAFAQDLEHRAKLAPQRELNLRRDVFVVHVLLGDRAKRVADFFR